MDPYNFTLQSYESIPYISQDQYQNRKESSKRIVLFKNLIVDLEGFDHPGYNNILTSFIDKDIYEAYTNKMHSLNADLILCHRTIGKLEDSPFDLDGKTFYNSVKNNEKVKKHQQVLEKYDPKAPIL
jgi:cytochrome b involved in lipid metabolism